MADSTHTQLSQSEDDNAIKPPPQKNSKVDEFLCRINDTYCQSKADQILRLLRDQEDLNFRFNDCDLHSEDSNDSDCLSDSSVKETEQRLVARLALHKQRGARSKTSMGFYNDTERIDKFNYSSDEDDIVMEERPNTRINRPKSSYVRRRTNTHEDSTDENFEDDFIESSVQRRCRSTRPHSRLGNRGEIHRSSVLQENPCNIHAPPASPQGDLIDETNYDKYAHTRTSGNFAGGMQRPKSRIKGFCDTKQTNEMIPHALERQKTVHDITTAHTYSSDEAKDEFTTSTRLRHRRQQFRQAKTRRPTSENVFLVRQRTEARMLQTQNNSVRPNSEKPILQQTKASKKVISIDTNPLQAAQNGGFQAAPSSLQSSQSNPYPYGVSQPRPASRRNHGRQDISLNAMGNGVRNTGRPIGVMKLPPLDPAVAKRAERIVLAARETCA